MPDAQNDLGACYANGTGVPQDLEEAAYWYECAAQQGHLLAQRNLSWLYYDGEGVPQDLGAVPVLDPAGCRKRIGGLPERSGVLPDQWHKHSSGFPGSPGVV